MTTFAGTLHAEDPASRAPLDAWRIVARSSTDADLSRRLSGRAELRVVFDGLRAIRREVRSYRPDGTLLRGGDDKPLNVGVSTVGWRTVPLTALAFSLAESPELGTFVHTSTAWATADSLARSGLLGRLEEGSPVSARLLVERPRFTARNGPAAGSLVDYSCAGVVLD